MYFRPRVLYVCECILPLDILENQGAKTTHCIRDLGENLGLKIYKGQKKPAKFRKNKQNKTPNPRIYCSQQIHVKQGKLGLIQINTGPKGQQTTVMSWLSKMEKKIVSHFSIIKHNCTKVQTKHNKTKPNHKERKIRFDQRSYTSSTCGYG